MTRISLSTLAVALLLVSTHVKADDMDASQEIVKKCDSDSMSSIGIEVYSWSDEVGLCDMALRHIGGHLEVGEFRYLLKTIYLTSRDGKIEPKEQEYQLLNIIEARGIGDAPTKVKSNLNTIAKIYAGSDGHVTPRDLDIFLQNAGDLARTLSDDGLMSMAAMISVEKKRQGD